jgi:hypothetical protein
MNALALALLGFLTAGLLFGSVNCLFNTRFYRRHPSSRLLPPENAVCDFLFTCMLMWPGLALRAFSSRNPPGTRKET